ncbi:carbon monoxide dehydrogenase subunit G [Methylopila sp. M107]|uniref:CoxG family protein n=1 Tax=Methylopila sp. M107 TaxID=1101190 RepID=UPI00037451BD|nr:carbon monoxide dehydrogenase subunit G [Methylopila sp. M107]
MDISGSHRIPASRAAVWAALNDLETLKACIPGCERLDRSGDSYDGVVASKIGPIRTELAGEAKVSASAPGRFTVSAKGADAKSGGGEGTAEVTLEEDGAETVLAYSGQAEAHGKISQLGQRLLTGVFRKTVETFAENLSLRLASGEHAVPPTETLPETPPLAPEAPVDGPPPVLEAPPLAAGAVPGLAPNAAIAPTAAPDVPDPAAIAAADAVDAGDDAAGASVTTRIMLVAAIVVVVGAIVYYMVWQQPPPM